MRAQVPGHHHMHRPTSSRRHHPVRQLASCVCIQPCMQHMVTATSSRQTHAKQNALQQSWVCRVPRYTSHRDASLTRPAISLTHTVHHSRDQEQPHSLEIVRPDSPVTTDWGHLPTGPPPYLGQGPVCSWPDLAALRRPDTARHWTIMSVGPRGLSTVP